MGTRSPLETVRKPSVLPESMAKHLDVSFSVSNVISSAPGWGWSSGAVRARAWLRMMIPHPQTAFGASMNVRPLYDRILVKRVEEASVSKGGLFLPETAKEKPLEGLVIAVGQGKLAEDGSVLPMQVKPDQRVMFGRYAGTEIKVDGEDRLVLREEEIFGILED